MVPQLYVKHALNSKHIFGKWYQDIKGSRSGPKLYSLVYRPLSITPHWNCVPELSFYMQRLLIVEMAKRIFTSNDP